MWECRLMSCQRFPIDSMKGILMAQQKTQQLWICFFAPVVLLLRELRVLPTRNDELIWNQFPALFCSVFKVYINFPPNSNIIAQLITLKMKIYSTFHFQCEKCLILSLEANLSSAVLLSPSPGSRVDILIWMKKSINIQHDISSDAGGIRNSQ